MMNRFDKQHVVARFSVPPYSRVPKKRPDVSDDNWPCAICGRSVPMPPRYWGVVINGGNAWGDESSPHDGGYMGLQPVGSDCYRKYKLK